MKLFYLLRRVGVDVVLDCLGKSEGSLVLILGVGVRWTSLRRVSKSVFKVINDRGEALDTNRVKGAVLSSWRKELTWSSP